MPAVLITPAHFSRFLADEARRNDRGKRKRRDLLLGELLDHLRSFMIASVSRESALRSPSACAPAPRCRPTAPFRNPLTVSATAAGRERRQRFGSATASATNCPAMNACAGTERWLNHLHFAADQRPVTRAPCPYKAVQELHAGGLGKQLHRQMAEVSDPAEA